MKPTPLQIVLAGAVAFLLMSTALAVSAVRGSISKTEAVKVGCGACCDSLGYPGHNPDYFTTKGHVPDCYCVDSDGEMKLHQQCQRGR